MGSNPLVQSLQFEKYIFMFDMSSLWWVSMFFSGLYTRPSVKVLQIMWKRRHDFWSKLTYFRFFVCTKKIMRCIKSCKIKLCTKNYNASWRPNKTVSLEHRRISRIPFWRNEVVWLMLNVEFAIVWVCGFWVSWLLALSPPSVCQWLENNSVALIWLILR